MGSLVVQRLREESLRHATEASTAAAKARQIGGHTDSVRSLLDEVRDSIQQMHDSTKEATDAVGSIDRAAFETNIVGFNALIASAAAGDAGQVFRVVAADVKTLSEEIRTLAKVCKNSVGQCFEQVQRCAESSQAMEDSLRQTLDLILEVSESIDSVPAILEEQVNGLDRLRVVATTINVAGRQRMLTQRMAKEFLLICYGVDSAANRQNLSDSMGLFDSSLANLERGNEALGLIEPEGVDLRRALAESRNIWDAHRPTLESALGPEVDLPPLAPEVVRSSSELLTACQRVVSEYEQSA